MTEPVDDPYGAARAHVEFVIDHLRLDDGTAARLRTAHESALRFDPATGDVTYLDGSPDPASGRVPGGGVAEGWSSAIAG